MNHTPPSTHWAGQMTLAIWRDKSSDLSGIAVLSHRDDRSPRWIRDADSLGRFLAAFEAADFQSGHLMVDNEQFVALEFGGDGAYYAELASIPTEGGDHLLLEDGFAQVDSSLREALAGS